MYEGGNLVFQKILSKDSNGNSSAKKHTTIRNVFLIVTLLFAVLMLSSCDSQEKSNEPNQENINNTTQKDSEDTTPETSNKDTQGVLSEKSSILRYQIGNSITDFAYLSYHFKESSTGDLYAQGFIDLNDDGQYTDDEWFIINEEVRVIKDFPNRFSFLLPDGLKSVDTLPEYKVELMLTTQKEKSRVDMQSVGMVELDIDVETELLDTEFGLDVPGASEDLKRGVGSKYQSDTMDFEETGVDTSDLPDLTGGPMDCFAIATANNLINMTKQNDRRDDLPGNPQDIMTELKNDMNYADGITNANFLIGKAAFVARYNLPITTVEIKNPSINDLADAFADADAVEISTTMIRSASGHANTGHVLTGVSAYQDGDDAGIATHDPATPEGTDTMDINMSGGDNQFIIIDYPLWDGIAFIDSIFLQYWDTSVGESDSVIMLPSPVLELAFAHVKPGEYSEVYAAVTGLVPGDEVSGFLYGGGHDGTNFIAEADENGLAYITWRISQYDDYKVKIQLPDGEELEATITVD